MLITAEDASMTVALRTAKALLEDRVTLAECLGTSVAYHPDQDVPMLRWLFEADNMLRDYSRPECRYLVAPPGTLVAAEEGPASALELDTHGRALAVRAFEEAAMVAMKMLVELAEQGDGISPRLRARLCAAYRQELRDLVKDWTTIEAAA